MYSGIRTMEKENTNNQYTYEPSDMGSDQTSWNTGNVNAWNTQESNNNNNTIHTTTNSDYAGQWYWDGYQYQYSGAPASNINYPVYSVHSNSLPTTQDESSKPDLVDLVHPLSSTENDVSLLSESYGQFGIGPDIITAPPDSNLRPSLNSESHEEHYAYYAQQLSNVPYSINPPDVASSRPPDVVRTDVPSSDRNLFMQTGHLDARDEKDSQQEEKKEEEKEKTSLSLPLSRLVLGENNPVHPKQSFVSGALKASSTTLSSLPLSPQIIERSEAVGSDKRDQSVMGSPPSGPPPSGIRNVEGGPDDNKSDSEIVEESDEPSRDSERLSSSRRKHGGKSKSHGHEEKEEEETGRGPMNSRRARRRNKSPSSSSGDDHRHRTRRDYDRSQYRYYHDGGFRDFRGDERSYSRHHNHSHHHPIGRDERSYRRLTYKEDSRPVSRVSNYDLDYSSRRSNEYYNLNTSSQTHSAHGTLDAAALEAFRKNWEYYTANPDKMEILRLSNHQQHENLLRYYQMYHHLLPYSSSQRRPASRNSVHSGQSSTEYHREPHRNYESEGSTSPEHSADVTPFKFTSPIIKGTFTGNGYFTVIQPKNPSLGQISSIDILSVKDLGVSSSSFSSRELSSFPGPLIPGITHKGEVIAFCQNKIQAARSSKKEFFDVNSYILIWELLILLLRQKNNIDGVDVSELLLKGRESLIKREPEENSESGNCISNSHTTLVSTTERFRNYLLYGHKKEGLEYAMTHGLWGHALFLASKMDERSYSQVLLRFANGLSPTDPLQTLYQQMSGRTPSAMRECTIWREGGGEEDWRSHLAMLLSNPSSQEGLDHKSICTLGDSLMEKGFLYAAHFCYLIINLPFGAFSDAPPPKIVLIGGDHLRVSASSSSASLYSFLDNIEAIQCTEIFEFVQRLSESSFTLISFSYYKFHYALKLLDAGLLKETYEYLKALSQTFLSPYQETPVFSEELDNYSLFKSLYDLAERLKFQDSEYSSSLRLGENPHNWKDPLWLTDFKNFLQGNLKSVSNSQISQGPQIPLSHYEVEFEGIKYMYDPNTGTYYQTPEQVSIPYSSESFSESSKISSLSSPTSEFREPQEVQEFQELPDPSPVKVLESSELLASKVNSTSPSSLSVKPVQKTSRSGGLFGRLLSRLVPAQPNQMHLPDDKDSSIVWNEALKKWVDTKGGETEEESKCAPPPSINQLSKMTNGENNNNNNNISNNINSGMETGNKFSLRQGNSRRLRGRVDVFKNNDSSSVSTSSALPPSLPPSLYDPSKSQNDVSSNIYFTPNASVSEETVNQHYS